MPLEERLEFVVRLLFNDESIVLTDETTAHDIPGWDSLANVNLMFAVEQEFGIQFSDEEFGQFANIGALKAQIARKAS